MDTYSVFHIDSNQLFREGLRRILSDSPFKIDGESSTFGDGLTRISELAPDVVILDGSLCKETPQEKIKPLAELSPMPKIVVLAESLCLVALRRALMSGVDGYLLKNMSPDALKQSLNLVIMGEKVFPTALARVLVDNRFIPQANEPEFGTSRHSRLSERETEILSCLVNGYSNKSIANHLDITEGTVKVHLKGILKKINAQNRTQAAIWALQHGIVNEIAGSANDTAMHAQTG